MMKKQEGNLLVEAMVLMVLLGLLLIPYQKTRFDSRAKQEGLAIADGFYAADSIAARWAADNFGNLLQGNRAPVTKEVEELASSIGYQTSNANIGQGIKLLAVFEVTPANCQSPLCSISWKIYPAKAVPAFNGRSGPTVVRTVAKALFSRGGMSDESNPSLINGFNASWHSDNPLGETAFVVVLRGAYSATQIGQSIRADGTQTLTSDWDVGAQDITGATKIDTSTVAIDTEAVLGQPCTTPNIIVRGGSSQDSLLSCRDGTWSQARTADSTVVNEVQTNN